MPQKLCYVVRYENETRCEERNGEGFMIQARNKSDDKVAGMLIISCFKNSAHDDSVAVDPDYKYEYISHLMEWRVIQHLQQLGIEYYELGAAAISPSYLWQPSSKNYGVSHFKEGWSRNHIKQTWVAEKYYSTTALEAMWRKKLDYLINYFSV